MRVTRTARPLAAAAALLAAAPLAGTAAYAQGVLVNSITVAGDATDLGGGSGPNQNRLSFGSDLYYDAATNLYYGLADRGPGGGLISYETRVQKFRLDVNSTTGAISNFTLVDTVKFRDAQGNAFNGLNPTLLNGNPATLGRSFDPEGFTIAPNGNFIVSDEYGPSVYEFTPTGTLVRAFTPPPNLLPRDNASNLNFTADRSVITSGRQDNRGYEGLALSADGTKVYAMLQDPLVNEGLNNDGRRSQNLRIVEYDLATGASTAQFIYQLESLSDINSRIPGTSNDFGATAQGRNIGISAIIPYSGTQFLVLERDNRGFGVDNPIFNPPAAVGSKRLFLIDLAGATDVSGVSLAGSNALPGGVTPVSKSLFMDFQAALTGAGLVVPEKIEGLAFGPKLNNGASTLILVTDNDFSVTQTGAGEQFDIYTNGTTSTQVALGASGPSGQSLIPSYIFSVVVTAPEPGAGVLALVGVFAAARFRRRGR